LLLELDSMEEGIKTDFDDLLRDGASDAFASTVEDEPVPGPDAQVEGVVESVVEVEAVLEAEPDAALEADDDVLGVAEARARLLAAVAALEPPAPSLSDEEAEALALAEAIENERRALED
jgi:segregation and condensation protein B